MKLRIYNIQLLPLDHEKTGDAGENRYIDLFRYFNDSVSASIKQKRLVADAKPLVNDSFFAALNSEKHIYMLSKERHTFIVGRFIKFHRAGEVEDLYTKATLFKAQEGQNAVANRKEFIYIFDPVSHWLGIEEQNGRLPNQSAVKNSLEQYLQPLVEEFFPDYTLTVNLVSRDEELQSVLDRAVGFTKIEINITFKNGPTQNEVLQDMAANSLHRLKITASSDRGSHMPRIPETIEGFVKNAPQYGQASITYLEPNDKGGTSMSRYESESNPQTVSARARGDEDPMSLYGRIVVKMKDLAKRIGHLPEVKNASAK